MDAGVAEEDLTSRILARRGSIPFEVVESTSLSRRFDGLSLTDGKRMLLLTKTDGEIVKPCPGTPDPYLCCRYTVINQVLHCPMDCTYCVLQALVDQPMITLFVNRSRIFRRIDGLLADHPMRFFRFGTGELSDSLALDPLLALSGDYTNFFSARTNAVVELKTKTGNVDGLLVCPTRNTVVSWSLNPHTVAAGDELGAASIDERLRSAVRCQDRGFLLGFHFDPILFIEEFERKYRELVDRVFESVDASRIIWISLGSLRFPPALKTVMQSRFPKSGIIHQEMIRGLDGKMRYPRPMRVEMYRKLTGWIRHHHPELFIYLCMESPWVWDAVMGKYPRSNGELDYWFADHVHRRFPEVRMAAPSVKAYAN